MGKDYGVTIAGRIGTDDYNLLEEIVYYRGITRSQLLKEVIHEYCENVRSNRDKIKNTKVEPISAPSDLSQ